VFPRKVVDWQLFWVPIEAASRRRMDTTAGVHSQIMVKSDASPLRLSPVDILAHVMLGLI
jgi:hypothetical protein